MICLTTEALSKIKMVSSVIEFKEFEIVMINIYDWDSECKWLGKNEDGVSQYVPYPSVEEAEAKGLIALPLQERDNQIDYGFVGNGEDFFYWDSCSWWAFFPDQEVMPVELWSDAAAQDCPEDLSMGRMLGRLVSDVASSCYAAKRRLNYPTFL